MLLTSLGETKDVVDNIHFFWSLIKVILPLLIILVIIPLARYVWQRIKRHLQIKECEKQYKKEIQRRNELQQKRINKINKEKQKSIDRLYKDKDKMFKKLDNISEPIDKSKYRDLNMYFDENGKAKL